MVVTTGAIKTCKAPVKSSPTTSGQIVGERGEQRSPSVFGGGGDAVPLAYMMTDAYNTSNLHDLKLPLLSIGVTLNHAFCNL